MSTSGGYTLAQVRAEMARLTGVIMDKNKQFLDREAKLIEKYGTEDMARLRTRMIEDPVLADAGGAARTCAILADALGTVIIAEIAYADMVEQAERRKQNRIVQTGGPMTEAPIATRPQDWAPAARRHVFPERT